MMLDEVKDRQVVVVSHKDEIKRELTEDRRLKILTIDVSYERWNYHRAQHESERHEGACFRAECLDRVIKIFSTQSSSSRLSMNASSSFRTRDAALFFSLFSIRVTLALDAPSSLANSLIILSSSGWILSSVAAS